MDNAFLIFLGVVTVALVNAAVLFFLVLGVKTFRELVRPPEPAHDTEEVYEPLNIDIPDTEEGVRENPYDLAEHEIVAGLGPILEFDEFIAAERRRELARGIKH